MSVGGGRHRGREIRRLSRLTFSLRIPVRRSQCRVHCRPFRPSAGSRAHMQVGGARTSVPDLLINYCKYPVGGDRNPHGQLL